MTEEKRKFLRVRTDFGLKYKIKDSPFPLIKIDARDHYTHRHSVNVTKYAVMIAQEMNLSAEEIEEIRQACELHDLGKIGIYDYVLTKPGKLTPRFDSAILVISLIAYIQRIFQISWPIILNKWHMLPNKPRILILLRGMCFN